MKPIHTKIIGWFIPLACLALFVAACGGASPEAYGQVAPVADVADEYDAVYEEESYELEEESLEVEALATQPVSADTSAGDRSSESSAIEVDQQNDRRRERLIIKNGDIQVLVEDSSRSINEVSDLTVAVGGYIISQRSWDRDGYRYASLKIAVPVEEFERTMQALRDMGTPIRDIATGEDVTGEFVDLESRLTNLEITQERLRTFLSQATKTADIIELNAELTKVEEEIALIKGRMNYLSERADFSTIDIQIDPIVPTTTPSPTPTMTPIPTVDTWRPGDTAQVAINQSTRTFQSFADFIIFNLIVCGPWLLGLGLIGFWILRAFNLRVKDIAKLPSSNQRSPSAEANDHPTSEE